MPALTAQHYVRGQYRGYTDIAGVEHHSTTETFVALRAEIDNWRWMGVPIFLRAGKALPQNVTEVRLFLRRSPQLAFLPHRRPAEPNQIVLRIEPEPGFRMRLSACTDRRGVTFIWTPHSPPTSALRCGLTNVFCTPG
jgi:glucose-6-phosphate 1-dehydrogenase